MVTQIEASKSASGASSGFDPDRLAYLEVAGWRAYYDRRWLRTLRLAVQLAHEQFGLSWPRAVQAAYYVTRSMVAWAPVDHDNRKVLRYLRKFYRTAARYGKGIKFDPDKAAKLEFVYWDAHRRLSGRPENEKMPLVRSFAALHSELFGLPPEQVWESAVLRARSTDTVDEITGRRSSDVEGDWRKSEEYLREAYRSIKRRV